MTEIKRDRRDSPTEFLFTDKLGVYLAQIPDQWRDIIQTLMVTHNDIGLGILEFVGVGKANPCADQTQTTDEGYVEQVHTSFMGMIPKAIVTHPLNDMKHKQRRKKSQVIDGR
jgi:hypothetical protein